MTEDRIGNKYGWTWSQVHKVKGQRELDRRERRVLFLIALVVLALIVVGGLMVNWQW